jgi:hypothetical protein
VQEFEVTFNDGIFKGLGMPIGIGVKGEAIPVDLGTRGTFFALLVRDQTRKDSTSFDGALTDIAPETARAGDMPGPLDALNRHKGRLNIPLRLLLRFCDLSDPKSVERVDPEHLDQAFGEGVKLIRATVEITSDPITTGIEKRLPWVKDYYNKRLDGERYGTITASNRLANELASGDFNAGMNP